MHKINADRKQMMAALLSAALILGTVHGAVPGTVLAQEYTGGGTLRLRKILVIPRQRFWKKNRTKQKLIIKIRKKP